MRRRTLVLALACAAVVLVAVAPAAANNKPTTGTRISLFAAPATFLADTPFYVEHGFICDTTTGAKTSDCMNAGRHFDLYVDGVLQPSTVDVDNQPTVYLKRYLTNFAAGLPAGPHTFVGVFVSNGVVELTLTATITFS